MSRLQERIRRCEDLVRYAEPHSGQQMHWMNEVWGLKDAENGLRYTPHRAMPGYERSYERGYTDGETLRRLDQEVPCYA